MCCKTSESQSSSQATDVAESLFYHQRSEPRMLGPLVNRKFTSSARRSENCQYHHKACHRQSSPSCHMRQPRQNFRPQGLVSWHTGSPRWVGGNWRCRCTGIKVLIVQEITITHNMYKPACKYSIAQHWHCARLWARNGLFPIKGRRATSACMYVCMEKQHLRDCFRSLLAPESRAALASRTALGSQSFFPF